MTDADHDHGTELDQYLAMLRVDKISSLDFITSDSSTSKLPEKNEIQPVNHLNNLRRILKVAEINLVVENELLDRQNLLNGLQVQFLSKNTHIELHNSLLLLIFILRVKIWVLTNRKIILVLIELGIIQHLIDNISQDLQRQHSNDIHLRVVAMHRNTAQVLCKIRSLFRVLNSHEPRSQNRNAPHYVEETELYLDPQVLLF